MSGRSDLAEVLRRTRLVRVLLVYLGGAFAALEAVDLLGDKMALPDWVFAGAVALQPIGLLARFGWDAFNLPLIYERQGQLSSSAVTDRGPSTITASWSSIGAMRTRSCSHGSKRRTARLQPCRPTGNPFV